MAVRASSAARLPGLDGKDHAQHLASTPVAQPLSTASEALWPSSRLTAKGVVLDLLGLLTHEADVGIVVHPENL